MIGRWRALKIEKLHVKGLKPLAFGKLLSCSWIYPRDPWGRAGPRLNRFKEFPMSLCHPDGSQWSLLHTLLQTLQCPWLDPYSLEQQRHLVISGLSPHLGSDNDSYFAFSTLHFLLHAFNSSLHNPACFLSGSVKVKVGQTCLTPCDPRDYTVHGILQARTLEWVAFPFSRGSSQSRDWTQVSRIGDGFFTSWATREALWVVYASANCITSWNLRFTSYR